MSISITKSTRDGFDYIPDTVVFGKFNSEIGNSIEQSNPYQMYTAIPSCRYKNGAWTSLSRFSRLTGFKPNVQRDAEKELLKASMGSCEVIENVPTSGFKIVSFESNPYCNSGKKYDYGGDAVVYDPRGFAIQISVDDLSRMIEENNGNISNYELNEVKYVYIASSSGMTLIPYESAQCKNILAKQSAHKNETGKTVYVKPSAFKVGHAYATSDFFTTRLAGHSTGIYIFAGRHSTYSPGIINSAIECGYPEDLTDTIKQQYGWTSQGEPCYDNAYVFFLAKSTSKFTVEKLEDIILVTNSPSKLFFEEVPVNKSWTWLLDSSKPLTIDSINDFMQRCPYFSQIDFKRLDNECQLSAMSIKEFARILLRFNSENIYRHVSGMDFPLCPYPFTYRNYFRENQYIISARYNEITPLSVSSRYSWSSNIPSIAKLKALNSLVSTKIDETLSDGHIQHNNFTIMDLYTKIMPMTFKLYFANGNEVDPAYYPCLGKDLYDKVAKSPAFKKSRSAVDNLWNIWNDTVVFAK